MSNRERIIFLSPRGHKHGIVSLDDNRFIARSAGNVNPASLSKSATTTLCITLKDQSSLQACLVFLDRSNSRAGSPGRGDID
jgi:hypothetical protein